MNEEDAYKLAVEKGWIYERAKQFICTRDLNLESRCEFKGVNKRLR